MNSSEIIKNISRIYKRFRIPPNLALHMLRAGAIAELICDNWKNKEIIKEDIISIALIHDLGNIVKFDFEKKSLKMLGKEIKRSDYWKNVRKQVISKYGDDDYMAAIRMANELEIGKRLHFLLKEHSLFKNKKIYKSKDYSLKICSYVDQRIGPFGIVSLSQRYDDIKKRYSNKGKYTLKRKKSDEIVKYAFLIEKQLFNKMKIKPEDINDNSIKPYLRKYNFEKYSV